MKQQPYNFQAVTPEVLAWIAAETVLGRSPDAIFKALLDSGWQHTAARQAMGLAAQEAGTLAGPTHLLSLPCVAMAEPGVTLDAGDKWVTVLQRRQDPELVVFGQVLSASECEALMEAARPRLSRSLTVDTQTGGQELNVDRTSQGMFFTRSENALVQRVEARIARLLNWPVQNGEGLQVLRYAQGAEYKPHHDYFDAAEPGTPALLKRGGQRVATLIMYLNEPAQGGATVFPEIGLRVLPQRGNAVFFSYACAHPASRSLHGGAPVAAGEKWVATKWLREHEFR